MIYQWPIYDPQLGKWEWCNKLVENRFAFEIRTLFSVPDSKQRTVCIHYNLSWGHRSLVQKRQWNLAVTILFLMSEYYLRYFLAILQLSSRKMYVGFFFSLIDMNKTKTTKRLGPCTEKFWHKVVTNQNFYN